MVLAVGSVWKGSPCKRFSVRKDGLKVNEFAVYLAVVRLSNFDGIIWRARFLRRLMVAASLRFVAVNCLHMVKLHEDQTFNA